MPKITKNISDDIDDKYISLAEGQERPVRHFIVSGKTKGFLCGHCHQYGEVVPVPTQKFLDSLTAEPIVTEESDDDDAEGYSRLRKLSLDDSEEFGMRYFEIKHYLCSKCGKICDKLSTTTIQMGKKTVAPTYPIWANHFENGDKVHFSWMVEKPTAFQNKLQLTYIKYLISINTKTGQSYMLKPYINGKPAKFAEKMSKVRTITYDYFLDNGSHLGEIPQDIMQALYECVYDRVCKRLGYNPPRLEDYARQYDIVKQEKDIVRRQRAHQNQTLEIPVSAAIPKTNLYNIRNIMLYNRQPNLNTFLFMELLSAQRFNDNKNRYRKVSAPLNDSNPLAFIMKTHHLPSHKYIRKAILKDYTLVNRIPNIMRYFKQPDNIRKLFHCVSFPNHNTDFDRNDFDLYDSFMRFMIDEFGETVWANKVLDGNISYDAIGDCERARREVNRAKARFDVQIQALPPDQRPTVNPITMDLTGNAREIHDRLSTILDNLKNPNIEIGYDDKERSFEGTYNGYEFRLAKDTYDLKAIGKKLHICVGGYGHSATEKYLTILVAYKDDEPKICVELRMKDDVPDEPDKDYYIKQAKCVCNHCPKKEDLVAMMSWVEERKDSIRISTTDLPDLYSYLEGQKNGVEITGKDASYAGREQA